MTTSLAKYEAARSALAAAHRVDEVKNIRDKAQAMAAYARQAKDTDMVEWATEIKVRAERRCGELTSAIPSAQGNRVDLLTSRNDAEKSKHMVLKEAGISTEQASRYERLAAMPAEHFETAVETAKVTAGAVTSAHMLRLAESLKMTRDLDQALKEARDNLDPESRASEAWRPIELAVIGLEREINKARDLPKCSKQTKAFLKEKWPSISEFLTLHMETMIEKVVPQIEGTLLRKFKVTIPVTNAERAVRIMMKSCEQRDLVELLSELGYTLHRIGAIRNWPEAMREMLARLDLT